MSDDRPTEPQHVVLTGAAGFIGGYVVQELLARGYRVTGVDDFSKYGPVEHEYDDLRETYCPHRLPSGKLFQLLADLCTTAKTGCID